MDQLTLDFEIEQTNVLRTSRSAVGMVASIAREYVGLTWDIIKKRFRENRVTTFIRSNLVKLDPFVTNPRIVKSATTFVSLETIGGLFTCIGTATLLIAAQNWPLAVGVVLMYVITVSVRYVLARNAMLETHNVKEA